MKASYLVYALIALLLVSCGASNPNSPITNPSTPPTTPREWAQVGTTLSTTTYANLTVTHCDKTDVPYLLYRNSGNSLTLVKWDGSAWTQIGTNFLVNAGGNLSFDFAFDNLNTPFVVSDAGTSRAPSCVKYAGGYWQQVGTADIIANQASGLQIIFNTTANSPIISFSDVGQANRVRVMNYSGAWANIGALLTATGPSSISRMYFDVASAAPMIAVAESSSVYFKKYSAGWVNLGGASIGTGSMVGATVDGSGTVYVAYFTAGSLIVKKYDGSSWVQVGTTIAHTAMNQLSMVYDGTDVYLHHMDNDVGFKITQVQKYTTDWADVGTLGIPTLSVSYLSAITGSVYLVYKNGALSENILKKY